jgi:hypothetical protein
MADDKTNPTRIIDISEKNQAGQSDQEAVDFNEASNLFENLFESGEGLELKNSQSTAKTKIEIIDQDEKPAKKTNETSNQSHQSEEKFEVSFSSALLPQMEIESSTIPAPQTPIAPAKKNLPKSTELNTFDSSQTMKNSTPLSAKQQQQKNENNADDGTLDFKVEHIDDSSSPLNQIPSALDVNLDQNSPFNLEALEQTDENFLPDADLSAKELSLKIEPDSANKIQRIHHELGPQKIGHNIRSGKTKQHKINEEFDADATVINKRVENKVSSNQDHEKFHLKDQDDEDRTVVKKISNSNPKIHQLPQIDIEFDEEMTVVKSLNDESKTVRVNQLKPSVSSSHFNEDVSPVSTTKFSGIDEEYMGHHHNELLKLNATVKTLRQDRERLMQKMADFEKENLEMKQKMIDSLAETDESKIELSLLRKRYRDESEAYHYNLKIAEDKKRIFEERCKNYQKDLERLNQKVRFDFNKIREREKELENQLDLLKSDSQVQISSRDNKILELKRQIDALEFNMENVALKEQKSLEDRGKLEEKVEKAMKTLRATIGLLENESAEANPQEILKRLKFK